MTEATLAAKFSSWLVDHSRKSQIPVFHEVFDEVECKQGIPDIIGLSGDWRPSVFPVLQSGHRVSLNALSSILALFSDRDLHTSNYLESRSGLSSGTAKQTLSVLCQLGLIARTPRGSFRLEANLSWLESDMWAFELKLHDWRRALFQTMQYRTFASYEVLVMPSEKRRAISRQLSFFQSAGIGVMLFDAATNDGEILVDPKQNKPTSKQHKIFAMCRLLQDCEYSDVVRSRPSSAVSRNMTARSLGDALPDGTEARASANPSSSSVSLTNALTLHQASRQNR